MLDRILKALGAGIPSKHRSLVIPELPVTIQGIGTGVAYTAGDVLGVVTKVRVPKSGVIVGGKYFDLDDENLDVKAHIFRQDITQTADNAAWAPSDVDIKKIITTLDFSTVEDHINSTVSEITNHNTVYNAKEGHIYVQFETEGAIVSIAAGSEPAFELYILSDDPTWE